MVAINDDDRSVEEMLVDGEKIHAERKRMYEFGLMSEEKWEQEMALYTFMKRIGEIGVGLEQELEREDGKDV